MGDYMPTYNNVGQKARLLISNVQTHIHIRLLYLKIWLLVWFLFIHNMYYHAPARNNNHIYETEILTMLPCLCMQLWKIR